MTYHLENTPNGTPYYVASIILGLSLWLVAPAHAVPWRIPVRVQTKIYLHICGDPATFLPITRYVIDGVVEMDDGEILPTEYGEYRVRSTYKYLKGEKLINHIHAYPAWCEED